MTKRDEGRDLIEGLAAHLGLKTVDLSRPDVPSAPRPAALVPSVDHAAFRPKTAMLVDAAKTLGIPVHRITVSAGSFDRCVRAEMGCWDPEE